MSLRLGAFTAFAFFLACLASDTALGVGVAWTTQFGTDEDDAAYGVSVDALGGVFVVGSTHGDLYDSASGPSDAFISKYDYHGTKLWSRQFGDTHVDVAIDVSADGLGNAYVAGSTDVFDGTLTKYDGAGTQVWSRTIETSLFDEAFGVSADALGNVYVAGYTQGGLNGSNLGFNDAFLVKYDAAGNDLWTRQFTFAGSHSGYSVSVDGLGDVYLAGVTTGNLSGLNFGGDDGFLRKYDGSGNVVWTRQFGTNQNDVANDVAADALGNIYVAGYTNGNLIGLNAGGADAFLRKYSATGSLLWTRQFGAEMHDEALDVSIDTLGNAYVTGASVSVGPGITETFVRKYSTDGSLEWGLPLAAHSSPAGNSLRGNGIALDPLGNVYIAGDTRGALDGFDSFGNFDAFAIKIAAVPEPASLLLVAIGVPLFWLRRRR